MYLHIYAPYSVVSERPLITHVRHIYTHAYTLTHNPRAHTPTPSWRRSSSTRTKSLSPIRMGSRACFSPTPLYQRAQSYRSGHMYIYIYIYIYMCKSFAHYIALTDTHVYIYIYIYHHYSKGHSRTGQDICIYVYAYGYNIYTLYNTHTHTWICINIYISPLFQRAQPYRSEHVHIYICV